MKTAIIGGLLLVVILVCSIFIKRAVAPPFAEPTWVATAPKEKICTETMEFLTLSKETWDELGRKDGRYKHPKTKQHTMVTPVSCHACEAKVPGIALPDPPPRNPTMEQEAEYRKVTTERLKEHRCRKCGEYAYSEGAW